MGSALLVFEINVIPEVSWYHKSGLNSYRCYISVCIWTTSDNVQSNCLDKTIYGILVRSAVIYVFNKIDKYYLDDIIVGKL